MGRKPGSRPEIFFFSFFQSLGEPDFYFFILMLKGRHFMEWPKTQPYDINMPKNLRNSSVSINEITMSFLMIQA